MKHKTSQAGFTLIELIAVMVILGILAAVIIPRISTLTSGAYESNVRSMYGVIKNEVNAQAIKAAMSGGASGHQETYPRAFGTDGTQASTATGNKATHMNVYLKEWVEDYEPNYWIQFQAKNAFANGNKVHDDHASSDAIVFGYFPHGVLNKVSLNTGADITTGGSSTDKADVYWIYYAPATTAAGTDDGIDFDGFFMTAFRDANNNGDFDARIAHTAAAADVAITLNGDEEITDLHWLTP